MTVLAFEFARRSSAPLLSTTLALLASACTIPPTSLGHEPHYQTSMGYAHTLEAEFDALGHVTPEALRWADLDRDQVGLSCVDGRAHEGVVGSPGGDAGELLLLLASAEADGHAIDANEVPELITAWIAEFGGFYMHTDVDALAGLARALAADPRFDGELGPLRDREGVIDLGALEAWVRQPPEPLREPLLAHLVDPDTTGCGHLRSILQAPEDYAVRPALAGAVIVGFYRRLWAAPEQVRFVVLEGHHHERAILDVEVDVAHDPSLGHEVPLVSPCNDHDQVFVLQPQAVALVRERAVDLLVARYPQIDGDRLSAQTSALGQQQLAATLEHLDVHVPIVKVVVDHEATPSVVAVHAAEG